MIFFETAITSSEVARYMASLILPEDFRNMRMEEIHLDAQTLNSEGSQFLKVTYTLPGRVEDIELDPEKHAFRLIQSFHPNFQLEKVQFIPHSSRWLWSQDSVRIYFTLKELNSSPSGEVFEADEAYVSLTRRQIFLSYGLIQEYLLMLIADLGLETGDEVSVHWDESKGGAVYRCGNTLVQWTPEGEEEFQDLLNFAGSNLILKQTCDLLKTNVQIQFEITQITNAGLKIPIKIMPIQTETKEDE